MFLQISNPLSPTKHYPLYHASIIMGPSSIIGLGPLEEEQLISLKEAAARSGLSTGFLRRLCRTGKIRATNVGQYWVTTWRAVAEYLEDVEKRSKNPYKYK